MSAKLTTRELEILKLLTEGKSNREITVELNIKDQTVKNILNKLFLKLGVTNRTQAAVKAIKENIGSRMAIKIKKEDTMATAYCMKCRKKVEIKNPTQITLKNDRPAVQGVCPVCGTKVLRVGKL